jgi:hypothetical protein
MFQLFQRARADKYFKSRSPTRDAETDSSRVSSIAKAIDDAMSAAEAERSGLAARVGDVLARAATTLGNGDDEYLTREPLDSLHQDLLGSEIKNGERRLEQLSNSIMHFKFLKAALLARFPDFKAPADEKSVESTPARR